jgi:hypothetical protein
LSWPGLARPSRPEGSAFSDRDRRDKPGDDKGGTPEID